MGPPRGRRRQRLRALLRRPARQEAAHLQAQDAAQGRRRALPRHRRGPRGRGDRLAPARRAQAQEHPGPPDGLPRDHQAGDPGRGREPAPDQRRPRRGPGGASHPRPPLRLRGQPGAVEEGHVRPLRGPRAVRGDPPGGRQGARADGLPRRVVLGPRGHLRRRRRQGPADVPGPPLRHRRPAGRERLGLRRRRSAQGQEGRPGPPRPHRRRGAGLRSRRHDVRRPLGRVQALPPPAVRAVPHDDDAAGGQPQARHVRQRDDVGRPAPVRERLHHLHAHRLDDAVELGHRGGPHPGPRAVRRGVRPGQAARVRQQGQERPGGARGDPPLGRVLPHPGADRPDRRAVPPLRAHLDAHGRLADEGRRRPVGLDAHRRCRQRRSRRGLLGLRSGHHLPRVPQGLRRGHGRRQALRRRPGRAAGPARGRPGQRRAASRPAATRPSRRRATPRRR